MTTTISFVNIGMHGHVNPTLPVVAELVARGHAVTYHVAAEFAAEVAATGARVRCYPPPERADNAQEPITLIEQLASVASRVLPGVLADLRRDAPDLVVHDAACVWGQMAARVLGVPAASSFTTFAFNERLRSPTALSAGLVAAGARHPRSAARYLRSRAQLAARFGRGGLPAVDLLNIRQPLNLVYTSRAFHPAASSFDDSYRFVGPCLGARSIDPTFPLARLRDPVLFASLGTVFTAAPHVLRGFAVALAPLAGTLVLATGGVDPALLGTLPGNVVARRSVPQPAVLARARLFLTHGGMNSVNEALYHGVPMLVVPQGADQPLVAARVAELRAGLALTAADAGERLRAAADLLLTDPAFRIAAARLGEAQRGAGGYVRAADELEHHLRHAGTPVR